MTHLKKLLAAGVLSASLGVSSAMAQSETIEIPEDKKDEVTTEIVAGLKAYLDGKVAEAKSTLEFAVQLVSQLKAKGLSAYLPPAIGPEWTREDGEAHAAGAAMFGGGISASATYTAGTEKCTVTITGDSPMLQSFSMMLANPAIASASGNTVKRVNGEKVIINNKNGDVQTLVNNLFVQYGGQCSPENKLKHTEKTDFPGLKTYQ